MKNITKITSSAALLALIALPTTALAWGNDNDYYWRSDGWRPFFSHYHHCNYGPTCRFSFRLVCYDEGCYRIYNPCRRY